MIATGMSYELRFYAYTAKVPTIQFDLVVYK